MVNAHTPVETVMIAAATPTRFRWAPGLALALSLCAGCGETGGTTAKSQTYPVTGFVKFKDGKPATGAAVQFTPLHDTSLAVSGDIQEDGSFTLFTVKGNKRVSGAPEGEYRVTVQLPSAGRKVI